MPKIIQINGKVTIKREQRLLVVYAERSNFTESKVNLIKNHVKIKTVSHCPRLRSLGSAWGLGGKRTRMRFQNISDKVADYNRHKLAVAKI